MNKNSDPLKEYLSRKKTFNPAITSIVLGSFAVAIILLSTERYHTYGWALFVALPFWIGLYVSLLASLQVEQSFGRCLGLSIRTLAVLSLLLLLLSIEGIICIIMALPISLAMTTAGVGLGYWIQKLSWKRITRQTVMHLTLILFPFLVSFESTLDLTPSLNEVESSVIINAPKQTVWDEVVTSNLPPPDELIFKAGIAYPIKAEIDGQGAGAVRYCVFSTGKFVEPIEVWDEPDLLQFSVTYSPPPMKELSIYSDVHPQHLDGYLKSKKGQFKLIEIGDNKTLLEGTTWYENKMWPESYWKLWSDYIIHKIHIRVLEHIKDSSERNTR